MLNLEKKYFVAPLCENFFSDLGVKTMPPLPPFKLNGRSLILQTHFLVSFVIHNSCKFKQFHVYKFIILL